MGEPIRLGSKVRTLRRREQMTQTQLAQKLGISPSYLNLIEHNRRPLSAPLLIKLAQLFSLDLKVFAGEDDGHLAGDLMEALGDPIFDGYELSPSEVRELALTAPNLARAVLALYDAYQTARDTSNSLAAKMFDGEELTAMESSQLPSEEVSNLIQRNQNYFPEFEEGAERLRRDGSLDDRDLYWALVRYLEAQHRVEVRIETVSTMRGAIRRFDGERRILRLSELLRRGSRNFQLAHQIGLLSQSDTLDKIARDQSLTMSESRALCRVVLANYFAGAVLMPYQPFLDAARSERYDLELLGHRFRTSFEQVCHRLTTLRRPGAEGIPFHLVRVDVAGNISKRFSGSGMRFARYSGACPRWNVYAAFLTPGMIRVQISRLPDGTTYFDVARTLRKGGGGFHSPQAMQAIGIGCEIRYAREMVYAEGMHLDEHSPAVPVGVTCRLCQRMDCEQRAFPALQHPLKVQEDVRGASFFAPIVD